MSMPLAVKPQETKPAPLPAYPVAPSSQTQTSSRGMVSPRHYAGGTAYAGVPKSVPHYAEGTASVDDPNSSPFMNAVHGFIAQQGGKAQPQSVSIPNAAANYFVRPQNAQIEQPPGLPVFQAPTYGPTVSELIAAHRGAFAQAAFGGIAPQAPAVTAGTTPGGIAATAAPTQPAPTVARGGNVGELEPGGEGVIPKGQPYASTPQEVATASANTGVNPAALQNVAGAARDAIANPTAHTPQSFADATRGKSLYQLGLITSMLHYDPAMGIFNAAQRHQAEQAGSLRSGGMVNPTTHQAYSQQEAEKIAQGIDQQREQQAAIKGGFYPYTRLPQAGQMDEYGNPVQ